LLKEISLKDLIDFEYTAKVVPSQGRLNLKNIDWKAKTHYPPCMMVLHQAVRSQHHLKHYGRLQYGLFLKGAGLSLEESMHFWKQEFCRKVTADQFDKNYSYNIRHSYGKEGKRTDYTPWNCKKILGSSPGTGEYHGCPFKTFK
jgi:DNA primase large subunit